MKKVENFALKHKFLYLVITTIFIASTTFILKSLTDSFELFSKKGFIEFIGSFISGFITSIVILLVIIKRSKRSF